MFRLKMCDLDNDTTEVKMFYVTILLEPGWSRPREGSMFRILLQGWYEFRGRRA